MTLMSGLMQMMLEVQLLSLALRLQMPWLITNLQLLTKWLKLLLLVVYNRDQWV